MKALPSKQEKTRHYKVTYDVTTYGNEDQAKQSIERMHEELRLQGFNFTVSSVRQQNKG